MATTVASQWLSYLLSHATSGSNRCRGYTDWGKTIALLEGLVPLFNISTVGTWDSKATEVADLWVCWVDAEHGGFITAELYTVILLKVEHVGGGLGLTFYQIKLCFLVGAPLWGREGPRKRGRKIKRVGHRYHACMHCITIFMMQWGSREEGMICTSNTNYLTIKEIHLLQYFWNVPKSCRK